MCNDSGRDWFFRGMAAMGIGALICFVAMGIGIMIGYGIGSPSDKTLSDKKIKEINRIINPR